MEEPHQSTTKIDGICVGSFAEWHNQHKCLPLLDLRTDEEYSQFHIQGSVHIPLASVRQRSYELPPRQDAFAVLVPAASTEKEEALQLIRDFFLCQDTTTNNSSGNEVGGANPAKRRRRSQKPWNVPLVILAEDNTNWKKAKELGFLVEGKNSNTTNHPSQFQPLPRMWQPDSMVKDVLLPLLSERLAEDYYQKKLSTSKTPKVYDIWDLGAGAGRDVAFLAEELKAVALDDDDATCNFCMVGMDQRYRSLSAASTSKDNNCEETNEECILFWKRRGIEDVTKCLSIHWGNNNQHQEHEKWFQQQLSDSSKPDKVQLSESKDGDNSAELTEAKRSKEVLCLYMVRFWNRSLMEFLAQTKLVKEGTFVAVSQFAKPHDGAPWNFEHPKEKNVLERNELSGMFSVEAGWRIVHDNIVPDSDHGRTLIQFLAVKA